MSERLIPRFGYKNKPNKSLNARYAIDITIYAQHDGTYTLVDRNEEDRDRKKFEDVDGLIAEIKRSIETLDTELQ